MIVYTELYSTMWITTLYIQKCKRCLLIVDLYILVNLYSTLLSLFKKFVNADVLALKE